MKIYALVLLLFTSFFLGCARPGAEGEGDESDFFGDGSLSGTPAAPVATPTPAPPDPRQEIIVAAQALLGTTEATGKNDGPIIEKIQASTGNKKGDPYCASFNYYVYREAGYGSVVPRSAWSPSWVARPSWTRASGGTTPLAADAFGIWFASKGRVAHTGLVFKWGDEAVQTLEANTSPSASVGSAADRNGDGIWSKRRLVRQIHSVRNWLDQPYEKPDKP